MYAQQGTRVMELITLMVLCFGVTPRLRLYFSALGDAEGSAYTLLPSAGGASPLASIGTFLGNPLLIVNDARIALYRRSTSDYQYITHTSGGNPALQGSASGRDCLYEF